MGLDDITGKIGDLVGGQADKIEDAVHSAADFVDEKTGHKHSDKIDAVEEKVTGLIDKLGGGSDDKGADEAK